ncbi:MAG: B12-binding domain-containing radical SAM protein [Spirochaetia bacterium]|nr:B12-binding domain-containing radical SAM protein [Spirochaetia bacterium]
MASTISDRGGSVAGLKVRMIQTGTDNEYSRGLAEANSHRLITPMLAIPYLAAVTLAGVDLEVIDEQNGLMDDQGSPDLVAISGMTMHANRMYALADAYRERGIPVVLGGVHVSFMLDEARKHADAVAIGEAEFLWPRMLDDFARGKLEPVYSSTEPVDLSLIPRPRLDLVDGPAYRGRMGSLNALMATRGCPHDCDFCCVKKMFGRNFRTRPLDSVMDELGAMDESFVLFADDNIIGNPGYARQLFQRLKPLGRSWGAQASIQLAENQELLDLAVDAGLKSVFLGIESVDPENLVTMRKAGVNNASHYAENLKRLHDKGVMVFGSFIVGLDHDDESVFENVYEFIMRNGIDFPLVNVLTPFPGTDLYQAMEASGRIVDRNWDRYNLTQAVFTPARMSADELQFGYDSLIRELNRHAFRGNPAERQRLSVDAF